mgnify:CR=1 FL=1
MADDPIRAQAAALSGRANISCADVREVAVPVLRHRLGLNFQAQAAGLDALGVGLGERVAVVSHNSARLLTSFFGVNRNDKHRIVHTTGCGENRRSSSG